MSARSTNSSTTSSTVSVPKKISKPKMSALDYKVCLEAANNLTHSDNSRKNYLFLEPVNLAFFPTYTEYVSRPMDLGTLRKNLESSTYSNRNEFFKDAMLCFENALSFHGGRKESRWIVKLAKEMMKLVTKEKRKVDAKATFVNTVDVEETKEEGEVVEVQANKKMKKEIKIKISNKDINKADDSSSVATKIVDSSFDSIESKQKATNATDGGGVDIKKRKKTKPSSKSKLKLTLSLKKKKLSGSVCSNDKSNSKEEKNVKTKSISPPNNKKKDSSSNSNAPAPPSRGKELPRKAITSQKTSNSSDSSKPKLSLRLGPPSRGKELPKAVSDAASSSDVLEKKKDGMSKLVVPPTLAPMTFCRKAQCSKIISALRQRNPNDSVWFLHPVADPVILQDYKAKIFNPIDFGTIMNRIEKDDYATVAEFVRDLRRVFGNCLRYNTSINDLKCTDGFRPVATKMLSYAEECLNYFIAEKELPYSVYPKLLYCWKICLGVLDTLLFLSNPDDKLQTTHFFLHPVSFFFGGSYPPEYLQKVKNPMDLGTVTSKLVEGEYQSVGAFVSDCRLVCENCFAFYGDRNDGMLFTQQAKRLQDAMAQTLGALVRYDQENCAKMNQINNLNLSELKSKFHSKKSPLVQLLKELRDVFYTDRFTKLSERATIPFERPVDINMFPDYLQYVETPMDLQTIERRISENYFTTIEDFEYDILLIFKSCEKFNIPKHNDHIVALSKHCAKSFRKLYSAKMKAEFLTPLIHPNIVQKAFLSLMKI